MPTFDDELAQLCRAGKFEAFNVLMLRWQEKVLNFAYHFLGNADDAHDVCQEVFLRAFRGIDTYEPKPGFSSWLFGIARNLCVDSTRRRRVRSRVSSGADHRDARDPSPSPLEHAERSETSDLIGQALQGLPEEQRTPIIMRHYLDMPFPEIADALQCPATTVKSRVYAGMSSLKHSLRRMGLLDGSESI